MKEQINKKIRIDDLIVKLGLAENKSKAKALIMSGVVFANGQRADKAGNLFYDDSEIIVKENSIKYVSRGGLKLEKAIQNNKIDVTRKIALDIGASTGGFTDCLLQLGANKVYAFDVGHGQLDWKIRNDSRVVVKEKINCRYLEPKDLEEKVDIVVIDVSFISLLKIVEPALRVLKSDGVVIALIKPQFEVGKDLIEKGGVIKDPKKHETVKEKISKEFNNMGLKVLNILDSPILGNKGNKEFLITAFLE